MGYFLIKQWCPHRGQTSDNPSCLFYGGMTYDYPLTEKVKSYNCYSSRKIAARSAMKYNTIWSKTEVFEIPDEMVIKYRIDKLTTTYVLAEAAERDADHATEEKRNV